MGKITGSSPDSVVSNRKSAKSAAMRSQVQSNSLTHGIALSHER